MDIFQINELTDEIMSLNDERFYEFLHAAVGPDLLELFQVQAIRDMPSLLITSFDELIEIFNFDISGVTRGGMSGRRLLTGGFYPLTGENLGQSIKCWLFIL